MYLSKRNWTQLDESEIAQLQTIAETTQERSSSMAKGVLCFFYDICYEDKIEGVGVGEIILPKSANESTDERSGISNYDLSIYPNPTQLEMTIFTNNFKIKIILIKVYDIYGKCLSLQTENHFYSMLKMNELANGVYILKVFLDNEDVIFRKIVKKKEHKSQINIWQNRRQ